MYQIRQVKGFWRNSYVVTYSGVDVAEFNYLHQAMCFSTTNKYLLKK